jgi:hypothetical protein
LENVANIPVTTVDIDQTRSPDVVSDIANIPNHFPANASDVVVAFQVLEHIPFDEFKNGIQCLLHAARRYVVISLPIYGTNLSWEFGFGRFLFRKAFRLRKWKSFKADEQHFWEVNAKGTTLREVRRSISECGVLEKDYVCQGNSYHRFFVIRSTPPIDDVS